MRTKLLMMSSAAILAGTLMAAGQAIQPGGQERSSSQGTTTQPQRDQSDRAGRTQSNQGTRGQAQDKNQAQGQERTQGQAPRNEQDRGQPQGGQERQQPQGRAEGAQERQGQQRERTQGQAPREQGQTQQREQGQQGQQGERGGNASISLTTEQKTKIRDTVLKERDAPRVGRVDFSVSEGTVVPRTVRMVEVPQVILDIHPQWRGYKYFIVNDELVIVEPADLRIVAVLPV